MAGPSLVAALQCATTVRQCGPLSAVTTARALRACGCHAPRGRHGGCRVALEARHAMSRWCGSPQRTPAKRWPSCSASRAACMRIGCCCGELRQACTMRRPTAMGAMAATAPRCAQASVVLELSCDSRLANSGRAYYCSAFAQPPCVTCRLGLACQPGGPHRRLPHRRHQRATGGGVGRAAARSTVPASPFGASALELLHPRHRTGRRSAVSSLTRAQPSPRALLRCAPASSRLSRLGRVGIASRRVTASNGPARRAATAVAPQSPPAVSCTIAATRARNGRAMGRRTLAVRPYRAARARAHMRWQPRAVPPLCRGTCGN